MNVRAFSFRKLMTGLFLAVFVALAAGTMAQAAAPAQVKITGGSASEGKVVVKWKAVKKAVSYNIYVKVGSGKRTLLKSRSAKKSTKLQVAGLTNNVKYTFYVSAVNKKGEEGKRSKGYALTPTVRKPAKVESVSITAVGESSVTLTWEASELATSYLIEQELEDGTFRRLVRTKKTKITIKGLTTGTSYSLGVRSFRKAGGASALGYLSERVTFTPTAVETAIANIHPYDTSTYKTDSSIVYAPNVAEAFVNNRGWVSPSTWLIWINTYTQHMYVFRGTAGTSGTWKLDKCYICSTGAGGGTPLGRMIIRGKEESGIWKFSNQQWAYWPSNIDSGAIHSQLYYPSGALWAQGALGTASSHGCVRLQLAAAKYIYDEVTIGSYVWVW